MTKREYAEIKGPYDQTTISERMEAFFLDNIGKIVTREQLLEVARDPLTGNNPENWHQRLSELRTDKRYTILSRRDTQELGISEYLMPSVERRPVAQKRIRPTKDTWSRVLERAENQCEWTEGGRTYGLREGDTDPVGGGTVKLTPDHKRPHAINPNADASNPDVWQALCGRHQVMKKNYWDDMTRKLNVYAIVQSATEAEKLQIYEFLKRYFGETKGD